MLFGVGITVRTVRMAVHVLYKSSISVFVAIHENLMFITSKNKHCIMLGDMNIDHLKVDAWPFNFFFFLNSFITESFAFT